jgi:hypothetical protein
MLCMHTIFKKKCSFILLNKLTILKMYDLNL